MYVYMMIYPYYLGQVDRVLFLYLGSLRSCFLLSFPHALLNLFRLPVDVNVRMYVLKDY